MSNLTAYKMNFLQKNINVGKESELREGEIFRFTDSFKMDLKPLNGVDVIPKWSGTASRPQRD